MGLLFFVLLWYSTYSYSTNYTVGFETTDLTMSVFDRLGTRQPAARQSGGDGNGWHDGKRQGRRTVPGEGYICNICNEPGHWIEQCPLNRSNIRNHGPPADYVCKICSISGHWIYDCPLKVKRAAAEPAESEIDTELRENTVTETEGDETVIRLYDTEVRLPLARAKHGRSAPSPLLDQACVACAARPHRSG